MPDQTVNIPLLRKAVEWAEVEAAKPPELCEWEQGDDLFDSSNTITDVRRIAEDIAGERL